MTSPRFPYTLTEEELAAPTMGEALCGWLDRKIAHERHQAGADDVVLGRGAVDEDTARRVVAFLNAHPEWHPWSGGRAARATKRKMRYRWGDGGEHAIPPLLLEAGAQALANLQAAARQSGHPGWARAGESLADFQLDSLVVNRYFPGEGIGAHRDPPRQNPKVIGITLGTAQETTRIMRFRKVSDKSHKVDIETPLAFGLLLLGPRLHRLDARERGVQAAGGRGLLAHLPAEAGAAVSGSVQRGRGRGCHV